MSELHCSRQVAASPDAVWAVLADFGAIATWAHTIDHSAMLTATRTGIGAARRVQVGRVTLVERIVTWDPPRTLAYRLGGLPPLVGEATNTWSVVPSATGTHVTFSARFEPGPKPAQRVAARLAAHRIVRVGDQLLTGLTTHLEASS